MSLLDQIRAHNASIKTLTKQIEKKVEIAEPSTDKANGEAFDQWLITEQRKHTACNAQIAAKIFSKVLKINVDELIHQSYKPVETFSLSIVLNPKQQHAKEMALSGKSFTLIGAAGTGKTTTQRSVAETLLDDQRLGESTFKARDENGEVFRVNAPSIAFVAFTRRASGNLRRAIHKNPLLEKTLEFNIMTIHALLEYEPETYYDVVEQKDKFRFVPRRTARNPLDITHLVIEEASMLGLDLWERLYEALPHGVQIIFIGDINQLPPVFGPSILNYALVQLPVVELTEVYRNQGIVLENAHRILAGQSLIEDANFKIIRGKTEAVIGQGKMAIQLGNFFRIIRDKIGDDGLPEYDPADCIILTPFNVQELGSDNMNRWIAQFEGDRRNAFVYEIIAGFNKLYLAEGDKVMVNKMDGVIKEIRSNPSYFGRTPAIPGHDLTRMNGVRRLGTGKSIEEDDLTDSYNSFSLEALENEKTERKNQASHIVTVELENGEIYTLKSAGDFSNQFFSLGYVLTVHKSQGSEWRKVFIIMHKEHSIMAYRELFYTAVTRARTKVSIIAKDFMVEKAIKTQRIKGDTLKAKIEYFNDGALTAQDVYCTKP